MKLVKNPFFIIGVGSVLCAIIIAVVGTLMNPSSSLINKYEKAWNEDDEDLFEECFSPDLDNDDVESALLRIEMMEAWLETLDIDADDVKYQILIGDAVEIEDEEATESVEESSEDDENVRPFKSIPTVVLIWEDDEVVYAYSAEQEIIEVDGKEYIYTGLE